MISNKTLNLLLFLVINTVNGFTMTPPSHVRVYSSSQPHHPLGHAPICTKLHAGPTNLVDLITQESLWNPIKTELNAVPVFCCSNDKGQPLQYSLGDSKVAFFFCDVDAAKAELEKAKKDTGLEGLAISPVPLGEVFEIAAKQEAVIIPSTEALEAAGAPAGMEPLGQQVPLFGCDDMKQDRPDGSSVTPFFVDVADADEQIEKAADSAGENGPDLEMKILPLMKAVQLAATSDTNYAFVPPEKSMDYLRLLNELQ